LGPLSVQEAERELNTCQAELEHLYNYAFQHALDLRLYYNQFSDVEAMLIDLKRQLELRRRPWWQKLLTVVARMINIVSAWLGLGPLLPQLPGIRRPPALPPG
jgi:hypothetical protein